MFFFQYHEVYLFIERKTSPQAYLSLKIWENVLIMGRLCQKKIQIYVQKITATK